MNRKHCLCGHSEEEHDIHEDEYDGDTLYQVSAECIIIGCNCHYFEECECKKCNKL